MSETITHDAELVPESAGTQERLLLSWPSSIKLLSNSEVWRSITMVFGISAGAVGVLLRVLSGQVQGLLVAAGVFVILMLLFVGVGICVDLFGGFAITFALTDRGIRSVSGRGSAAAANAAFWVGVLAGKPGCAGAGLLARSEQDVFVPYSEVTTITVKPAHRYVYVKGELLSKPIGMYCTPENLDQVVAILKARCPNATIRSL